MNMPEQCAARKNIYFWSKADFCSTIKSSISGCWKKMALIHLLAFSTTTFTPPLQKLAEKPRITIFSQAPSHQLKKNWQKWSAVAEDISAAAESDDQSVIEEEAAAAEAVVRYDWSEEWYPLYLTKNVPHDAPLGLTVFDKQVVLFRGGDAVIRCYEDRCPHR